jgi:hypothetical protein
VGCRSGTPEEVVREFSSQLGGSLPVVITVVCLLSGRVGSYRTPRILQVVTAVPTARMAPVTKSAG